MCAGAADAVGEGANAPGPFSEAQQRFFKGQIIPLVAGAFGEIGRDFEKVLNVLADGAAASDDGMTVSPLRNLDRKGDECG